MYHVCTRFSIVVSTQVGVTIPPGKCRSAVEPPALEEVNQGADHPERNRAVGACVGGSGTVRLSLRLRGLRPCKPPVVHSSFHRAKPPGLTSGTSRRELPFTNAPMLYPCAGDARGVDVAERI